MESIELNYILRAYGHLIPFSKKLTPREFLRAIKESYCLENRRNKLSYLTIQEQQDKIEYFEHDIRGIKRVQFKSV